LGYLKSLVPDLKRVALLYHAQDDIEMEVRGAEAAADILGISIDRFPVRSADDFASAFDTMVQRGSKAIHISASGFTNFHRKALAELSMSHRLPSINAFPEYPEAGGLISYGATLTDGWKRAAYFVDRIIKGASPSDLPAEEPTKFYLTINQRIATNLGITIPDIILIQADKIIE
jgi:putative ABC transport system substrate-binding protein